MTSRASTPGGAVGVFAVAAVLAATRARAEGTDELVEREIRRGDTVATLVTHRGQPYQRIEVSDLQGLSVGDADLRGLPVCVEGKFERRLKTRVFVLMGSDRQFTVTDVSLVDGVLPGDNVWLGGVAQQVRGKMSCFLAVRAVVVLPRDGDLFRERSTKFTREGSWEKLLALGRWIEANGKLASRTIVADVDQYRRLRDEAFWQALRVREQTLPPDEVDARFETARMYRDLLGRQGDLKAAELLRQVLELDPGHAGAAGAFEEMGYVSYKGRWMKPVERDDLMRREQAAPKPDNGGGGPEEGTAAGSDGPPPETLAAAGRARRMFEVERLARRGQVEMRPLAEGLPREDEAVARRLVWILANTGAGGLEGLVKALRSRSATVRRDVADALAWRGRVEDLSGMIRSEKKPDVRSHAVGALGCIRTPESVDALLGLLSVEDAATRSRVGEELARVTGQNLADPEEWRKWWDANRDSFRAPDGLGGAGGTP